MSLFSRSAVAIPQRMKLENHYNSAIYNIYLVVVFTAINIVLMLANSNTYFLFSATIPYYLVFFGKLMCGKMPDEYYDPTLEYEFFDESLMIVLTVIAVVITVLYLLCAIFSRKQRVGWIIAATVLFSLDTILMFLIYGFSVDMLIDIFFHAWVLYYLIAGVVAHYKLKNLPDESEEMPFADDDFASEFTVNENNANNESDASKENNNDSNNKNSDNNDNTVDF